MSSFGTTHLFWARVLLALGATLAWGSSYAAAWADVTDDDDDDYDPLPGRTSEQIEALIFNFDEVVETVALYTALIALLAILFALAVSMRLRRSMAYVGLTTLSLVWFAFAEQQSNGLFWIGLNFPFSSLTLLGLPLISGHFICAGTFVRRKSRLYPVRYALWAGAVVPWLILPFAWPLSDVSFSAWVYVLGTMACLSHLITLSSYTKAITDRFYTRRNLLAVLAVLALTALTIFGELDEEFDVIFAIRSGFVAVVNLFAFFQVQFVIQMLRERDASVREALAAARREADQKTALLEAEKKYTRAREAAQMHTRRLATASHDIRQPIASLRSTMAAVAQDQPIEVQTQLRSAFDYLDGLAKSYMETADAPNAPDGAAQARDSGQEVISARMLTDTLDRMFRREAEAKGLRFDLEAQDQDLRVQPLVLTRILSNLISNAVKHTASGDVRVSGGQGANGYQFAVANSAALPAASEDADLFDHGTKGDASDGSGFGLAIIRRLSETHGMALTWSSDMASGTEFTLTIPGDTS